MTHKELVMRAAKWLTNTRKCSVVVTEFVTSGIMESPDALGWKNARNTILIECKTSKADFNRDHDKPFRRFWEFGLGQTRYYLTPPGLITVEDLPDGWGLLYCHASRIQIVHEPKKKAVSKDVAWNEVAILYSLVRRAVIRGFDVHSPYSEAPKAGRKRRKRRKSKQA